MITSGTKREYVAALFTDRPSAEAAVAELRVLGIADEHLGVAVRGPSQRAFEDDVEHDEALALAEGAVAGVPLGAVAGIGLVALAVTGMGTVAMGGLLTAGGAVGAVAGAFFGSLVGMATADHEMEERRTWESHPLPSGTILVVARGHGQGVRVQETLESHGGSPVDIEIPLE